MAPFPAAPLLTDTRRSTVGSGTREDHDVVQVRDLRRTRQVRGDPGCFVSVLFRSSCVSGGGHRTSSCRDRSTCAVVRQRVPCTDPKGDVKKGRPLSKLIDVNVWVEKDILVKMSHKKLVEPRMSVRR